MDQEPLLRLATDFLRALERFPEVVPPEAVMTVASNGLTDWQADETRRRIFHRVLDLLKTVGAVAQADGYNLQITDVGRDLLRRYPNVQVELRSARASEWFEMQELNEAMSRGLWATHTTFNRLRVREWRQFGDIDIVFHPRLTILTGVNAAGKTTLLNLLAPHFSWNAQLVARKRSGAESTATAEDIGYLWYSSGVRAQLTQGPLWEEGVQSAYVNISGQQDVAGIFISSHRAISGYRSLESLPARFSASETLLQQFASEVQSRYQGGNSEHPPLYRMKEGLVSAATYGYGNRAVVPNPEAREVWEGFQEVLQKVLPVELEFKELLVADGELLVCTHRGDFAVESASGGVSAMLELSWQIFLRSRGTEAFTVCIDEPENHLHPELQRSVVPALLAAFPNVRFILSTHSPFVVTAVADASIYALERGATGKVNSRKLTAVNTAASTDETLTNVLGVSSPLALWVEDGIKEAVANLPVDPSPDELRSLQSTLREMGLSAQFPAAIDALTKPR